MKNVLTGEDVEIAFQTGKKVIHVGSEDIVTSIAGETAEKYGIQIVMDEEADPSFTSNRDQFLPDFVADSLLRPQHMQRH